MTPEERAFRAGFWAGAVHVHRENRAAVRDLIGRARTAVADDGRLAALVGAAAEAFGFGDFLEDDDAGPLLFGNGEEAGEALAVWLEVVGKDPEAATEGWAEWPEPGTE